MTQQSQITSAETQLFLETLRRFLEVEVSPYYEEWEKAEIFPRTLWNKLGENGFLCVDQPVEYGGYGVSFELSCAIVDEVSRAGFAALASSISVHSDIVAPYIGNLGTESQKQEWLPKMVTGEVVGAIGMTEPGAGSDLQSIKMTAIKDGDDYQINGQKTFITNGQHCDVIILATKTDVNLGARGMSLFVVDCKKPGFQRGRNLEKMGLHSGDTSEVFLDDVRVSSRDILGGEGKGFSNLMNELPRERLILGISCVGAAQGAFDLAVDYVLQRQAFGQAIAAFQATRYKLAELKTRIELSRALAEKYVQKFMAGELSSAEASMLKLAASEMQGEVVDQCLQMFGGYGYMKEYRISRAYVDARIQRIYGGTSEIMKELISRSIVDVR
ncbi:MAG: acyl-CoA dehydrogenase [Gammaproteobacteria bacterium]|nr:acyl-CoA dehydrogenase [Gammaproteobacteria bacterium]